MVVWTNFFSPLVTIREGQGGNTTILNWSPDGSDKSDWVDLSISFPANGRFGFACGYGTSSVVLSDNISKTKISIATHGVTNLYAYFLAIGY